MEAVTLHDKCNADSAGQASAFEPELSLDTGPHVAGGGSRCRRSDAGDGRSAIAARRVRAPRWTELRCRHRPLRVLMR